MKQLLSYRMISWPVLSLLLTWGLGPLTVRAQVDFNQDIKPILSDRCFKCHGPDAENRQAGLRLDVKESALSAVASNERRVIAAGVPDESELLQRIEATDPDRRMPPAESKLELSTEERSLLRDWIAQGAEWQQHWSFVPLAKNVVPEVSDKKWPHNEIDHFVLARLEHAGLRPSLAARKEHLIRRLTFDLTGLPPTIKDLDDFLTDPSDNAYEKIVDRLLESSAYGERMAADWLDVARYADSFGLQVDRERSVWAWRDWVVRSFNQNQPYDEFVTWQVAGDLLPAATDEQVLATTFNRLHSQKVEGGSTPEEFRVEYVADRNHTFATAFLGLTLECARCHDHKFDPITQKEYYQFFAFFNNIDEAGLYSYFTNSVPTPTLLLPNDEQRQQIAEFRKKIASQETTLQAIAQQQQSAAFDRWWANRQQPDQEAGEPLLSGEVAHLDFEEVAAPNLAVAGKMGKAVQLTGDDAVGLNVGNFPRSSPFSISLWMNTPDVKERAVIFHRSRAWTDAASRGYQLLLEEGCLSASLIHFWPGNAMRIRTQAPIPVNEWLHVTMTYDGSARANGLALYVNGMQAPTKVIRDQLTKNITGGGGDNIAIGQRFRDRGFTTGLVDEFRVYDRQLTEIEVLQLFDGESLNAVLQKTLAELSPAERQLLASYYLSTHDDAFRKQLELLRETRLQLDQLVDGISEIMVMRELEERRPTFVLKRGAYDAPTEEVLPGTPAVFPALQNGASRDRLGLAQWLTDPNHPLTSRVAVNHLWQLIFGQGFVRTPEDFGSQSAPPTHPGLLDWLARDFINSGWDVKRMIKLIVMSQTYQQTANATEELRQRDPENLMLARAPKYRLPAEMIRDNALASSGLLIGKMGGPPVRPYELGVSFKPINPDQGDGLYRRSLYTFWKRTAPAPVMMSLDASKREVCSVQRERTASPSQWLVLMNDPQYFEAARVLGQRALKKHPEDVQAMIKEIFRKLTSRQASAEETAILTRHWDEQTKYFEEHLDQAEALLKVGSAPREESLSVASLAAAATLTSILMNFDDCVIKQ